MKGYSSKQIIKILMEDGWYSYGKAASENKIAVIEYTNNRRIIR